MKYLRVYENFGKQTSYEFNLIEFFNSFKKVFYANKNEDDHFISEIKEIIKKNPITLPWKTEDLIPRNWKNMPFNDLIRFIIENEILKDKRVKFYDIDSGEPEFGRVKYCDINVFIFRQKVKTDTYTVKIDFYENKGYSHEVDYIKPIKIYGEPTKIEKLVKLLSTANNYNL